jgi:protein disulfide-isomerase
MPRLKKILLACAASVVLSAPVATYAAGATGEAPAYDEAANANKDLAHALDKARLSHKPVLVVFGANWCPDCRALARQMAQGRLADKLSHEYVITKVDVGNWDKNQDIAERYGNPIKKGIPAVAVLSPEGKLLHSTAAGELASARDMGEDDLLAAFAKLAH